MADAQTRYEPFELDGAWLVYPRGDKLELTDSIRPVAAFLNETHARAFCERMWPSTGEVIQHTEWLTIPDFLRQNSDEETGS